MNHQTVIHSEYLSYDKHLFNPMSNTWTVYFTYNRDHVRDLFSVEDLKHSETVIHLGLSGTYDPSTQSFEDVINVYALCDEGHKEYDTELSKGEKFLLKEELIAIGKI